MKKHIKELAEKLSESVDLGHSTYIVEAYLDNGGELFEVFYNIDREYICTDIYRNGKRAETIHDEKLTDEMIGMYEEREHELNY